MPDPSRSLAISQLLWNLKHGTESAKLAAAGKLAQLDSSEKAVIEALVAARETDKSARIREAAALALSAPVHQAFITQCPTLIAGATEKAFSEAARSEAAALTAGTSAVRIWAQALTRPSVNSFELLSLNRERGTRKAFKWLFGAALFPFIIFLLLSVSGIVLQTFSRNPGGALQVVFELLLGSVFWAAVIALGLLVFVGISHLTARMLGGQGTYGKLVFSFATFVTPLGFVALTVILLQGQMVINSVAGGEATSPPVSPGMLALVIDLLLVVIGVYSLVLSALAIKAVHRTGWGKTVLALMAPYVVTGICVVLLVIITMQGPANSMQ